MFRRVLFPALALVAFPGLAAGQGTQCQYTQDATGRTSQIIENGTVQILFHDPFVVTCDDGAELRANSGRYDRTARQLYLFGDVFFQDSLRTLTAREATYDAEMARLWARGDVEYVDRREGSTLRGPELEYLRPNEQRLVALMTATQRPTLTVMPQQDTTGAEPLDFVADRITVVGEDQLTGLGSVVITRPDLRAMSEIAEYNSATEVLELRERAVIYGEEFQLFGEAIEARLAGGSLEYLLASRDARLQGEELEVEGEALHLFFRDQALERAVAIVPPEADSLASAASSTFRLVGDSLDAVFVDQTLHEVYAVGRARGETIDTSAVAMAPPPAPVLGPDTAAQAVPAVPQDAVGTGGAVIDTLAAAPADLLASDWIAGDTIVGTFAPVRPQEGEREPDTPDTPEPAVDAPDAPPVPPDAPDAAPQQPADDRRESVELRQLVARGSAQSLYRLRPENAAPDDPRRNVNFVVGKQIVLNIAEGELQEAVIEGLEWGLYLEAQDPESPEPGSADTPADGVETPEAPQAPPAADPNALPSRGGA